ncbi:MAG: aminotransferase class I/II-fold pyridoxal phosphate-dependent enzyme [Pseudomonadota bacterium]
MAFQPFAVEQYLSETEHGVRYNFSESGVHPMTLGDACALAGVDREALWEGVLDYPQVNGSDRLRAAIAGLYPGAGPENVLVTVGATEANTLVAGALLRPGARMLTLTPTYGQLPGNGVNLGAQVVEVPLSASDGWRLDPCALRAALSPAPALIHVVNPNNPTGQILSDADRMVLEDAADGSGAWLVADEVYGGTERAGRAPTASLWRADARRIVINSLSKAYGLPGLRLGWVVAPEEIITAMWRRHEYAAIAAPILSMVLAEAVLQPAARARITARARGLIDRGFETFQRHLRTLPGMFTLTPPMASAMSFVGYDLPIGSEDLARRLRTECDVLVVPGARFGCEGHFRFSSALPEDHLEAGLSRMMDLIKAL